MDSYTLNTVNYNYKTLSHEGFGGICKYIATPKRVGVLKASYQARKHTVRLQHLYVQSACRTMRRLYAESLSYEHKR